MNPWSVHLFGKIRKTQIMKVSMDNNLQFYEKKFLPGESWCHHKVHIYESGFLSRNWGNRWASLIRSLTLSSTSSWGGWQAPWILKEASRRALKAKDCVWFLCRRSDCPLHTYNIILNIIRMAILRILHSWHVLQRSSCGCVWFCISWHILLGKKMIQRKGSKYGERRDHSVIIAWVEWVSPVCKGCLKRRPLHAASHVCTSKRAKTERCRHFHGCSILSKGASYAHNVFAEVGRLFHHEGERIAAN